MENNNIILRLNNINKRFGGTIALKDVSLEIAKAECHAIVGENGAGKTTLLNILNGAIIPDSGYFEFEGVRYDRLDPKSSILLGFNIIHQELALVETLSVMENIFLSNLGKGNSGFVKNKKQIFNDSRELLKSLGSDIDPSEIVENLSTSKKQIVEIAKALSSNPKLLIMDEPTAALTQAETEKLFEVINILKKRGISIIFVSHRLNEVMRISDRVSVLRDGYYIGTVVTKEVNVNDIIGMMVGRKIELYQRARTDQTDLNNGKDVVLEVSNFTKKPYFENINFVARKGEILTFSGLVGSGRTELFETLFGFTEPDSGNIKVFGKPFKINSPKQAMFLGIGLLPEDRKIKGIISTMSVRENASIAVLSKLFKSGIIRRKKENDIVNKYVELLRIKLASIEDPVTSLSGGNQQKVMLARLLSTEVKILIIDEPTQGIDVGAKSEIHKLLIDLASKGVAIIIISSDLPEVLSISERIIVMRSGSIVGELKASEATEQKIMELATIGLAG